jgi:hypothetical protein
MAKWFREMVDTKDERNREKCVAIKRDEEKVFGEEKGLEKYFEIKRDEEK